MKTNWAQFGQDTFGRIADFLDAGELDLPAYTSLLIAALLIGILISFAGIGAPWSFLPAMLVIMVGTLHFTSIVLESFFEAINKKETHVQAT